MEEFAKWRAGAPERNNHLVGNRRQRRGSRIKEKGGRRQETETRKQDQGERSKETGFVIIDLSNVYTFFEFLVLGLSCFPIPIF